MKTDLFSPYARIDKKKYSISKYTPAQERESTEVSVMIILFIIVLFLLVYISINWNNANPLQIIPTITTTT